MARFSKLHSMLAVTGGAALTALAAFSAAGDTKPEVTVQLFQFRPAPLAVPMGTSVSWINQDDITHTITSGTPTGAMGGSTSSSAARARAAPSSSPNLESIRTSAIGTSRCAARSASTNHVLTRKESIMKRTFTSLLGVVAAAAVLTTGLGAAMAQSSHSMVAMATSGTKAAGLRSTLNTLFQEHIYLASAATGAALGALCSCLPKLDNLGDAGHSVGGCSVR